MQQEENYLAQSISQVDADARYDEGVKRLLANKSILAVIMKECRAYSSHRSKHRCFLQSFHFSRPV